MLWLLEELCVKYQLVRYCRGADHRAPPDLARVHPLGKSPVIVDGGLVLAESASILRYVEGRYEKGGLTPPYMTRDHAVRDEWLDYVESSAALPIMVTLLGGLMGGLSVAMKAFAAPQVTRTIDYIAQGLGDKPFLMGGSLMLADIQMSYVLGLAQRIGALDASPVVARYFEQLQTQPAFTRAVGKGGSMMMPA